MRRVVVSFGGVGVIGARAAPTYSEGTAKMWGNGDYGPMTEYDLGVRISQINRVLSTTGEIEVMVR